LFISVIITDAALATTVCTSVMVASLMAGNYLFLSNLMSGNSIV